METANEPIVHLNLYPAKLSDLGLFHLTELVNYNAKHSFPLANWLEHVLRTETTRRERLAERPRGPEPVYFRPGDWTDPKAICEALSCLNAMASTTRYVEEIRFLLGCQRALLAKLQAATI